MRNRESQRLEFSQRFVFFTLESVKVALSVTFLPLLQSALLLSKVERYHCNGTCLNRFCFYSLSCIYAKILELQFPNILVSNNLLCYICALLNIYELRHDALKGFGQSPDVVLIFPLHTIVSQSHHYLHHNAPQGQFGLLWEVLNDNSQTLAIHVNKTS